MDIILYLLLFIQYQHKQIYSAGFLILSADISLSSNGLSMIPIPQNIRNSRLISSQKNNLLRKMGLQRLHSLPRMEVWQENQTCQSPF